MRPVKPDPWAAIAASSHPSLDNVRRIEATHPIDFRRGRDFLGRYILFLDGRIDGSKSPTAPKLSGVDVTITSPEDGVCRISLTLLTTSDLDIFQVLCYDLLTATARLPSGANARAIEIAVARLNSWQQLLKRKQDQSLSKSQVIGLFGELLFLRDVIIANVGVQGVAAWRGSFGDEQDFVHGSWIVEVKTQISTADQRLLINSEAQLDTASGNIAICHQTLGVAFVTDPEARTLNSLVQEIRQLLSDQDSAAAMNFEVGLTKVNYRKITDYDDDAWVLSGRRVFLVGDEFPRLVPSMLKVGIERVTYHVRIEACRPFEMELAKLVERIFG